MGTGWQITCGNCGHIYEANSGGGMTGSYMYCDDCGLAEFVPYHFNLKEMQEGKTPTPAPVRHCSCGGVLSSALQPACPKCHSRLMRRLEDCAIWD